MDFSLEPTSFEDINKFGSFSVSQYRCTFKNVIRRVLGMLLKIGMNVQNEFNHYICVYDTICLYGSFLIDISS